jgi:hypothetical protein
MVFCSHATQQKCNIFFLPLFFATDEGIVAESASFWTEQMEAFY